MIAFTTSVFIFFPYENAYNSGGSLALPKSTSDECGFRGMIFRTPMQRSLYVYGRGSLLAKGALIDSGFFVEDPPGLVLKYPLAVGKMWIYKNYPWRIGRQVVSKETVAVQAGTFECFKIRTLWDFEGDGFWDEDVDGYDYISTNGVGLIRRILYFSVVDGHPNENEKEVCDLVKFNLK